MGFSLAKMFVEIGSKDAGFNSGVDAAKGKMISSANIMKTAVSGIVTALGPVAAAFAGFDGLKAAVLGASDLAETVSKVDVVFGDAKESVTAFADTMSSKFGSNKKVMLDSAASIGLIAKAAGLSQPAAAGMATSMAKLADDASSFYNVPLEEALDKIKSALVGESEPIRSFGVLLNEAAVQNEALALGLVKSTKDLTEQHKVMARSSLIMKGMKDAEGDHERTASSFSNSLRELVGRLSDMATTVGTAVVPALAGMLSYLNESVKASRELGQELIDFGRHAIGDETTEDLRKKMDKGYKVTKVAPATGPDADAAKALADRNTAALKSIAGEKESELLKQRVDAIKEEKELEAKKERNRIADVNLLKLKGMAAAIGFERDSATGKTREIPFKTFDEEREKIDKFKSLFKEKLGQALRTADKLKQDGLNVVAKVGNRIIKEPKKEVDFRSESFGAADFARKLQAGVFESKDKTAEKQLEALEEIKQSAAATAKALKNPRPATFS